MLMSHSTGRRFARPVWCLRGGGQPDRLARLRRKGGPECQWAFPTWSTTSCEKTQHVVRSTRKSINRRAGTAAWDELHAARGDDATDLAGVPFLPFFPGADLEFSWNPRIPSGFAPRAGRGAWRACPARSHVIQLGA